MRKGKELYAEKYDSAMALHRKGVPLKEIAESLGISYSAVYAWTRGTRKPSEPVLVRFRSFLEKNGPTAAIDIKSVIPKHDDFYHIAVKRNIGIKRVVLDRRFREYRVWYYLAGQEQALESCIKDLREKYKVVKEK
ncbi:MAG: helix-turn-helix domain-containing protein, partial [Candidatus Aenigmatarchaeota archaeon]